MLAEQVAALFDQFCDEDDVTFVTAAQKAIYLARGYARFRTLVRSHDPHFYHARATITLAGTDSYDLALAGNPVRVMGTNPTSTRLSSLIRVVSVDASGNWLGDYLPAASWEELHLFDRRYLLAGTVLYFSGDVTGSVRLEYVPIDAVDWTDIEVGDNEFIDELDEFHDLIAMFAYGYYAVRDAADNLQLQQLMAERKLELQAYLTIGRNHGAADHGAWSEEG